MRVYLTGLLVPMRFKNKGSGATALLHYISTAYFRDADMVEIGKSLLNKLEERGGLSYPINCQCYQTAIGEPVSVSKWLDEQLRATLPSTLARDSVIWVMWSPHPVSACPLPGTRSLGHLGNSSTPVYAQAEMLYPKPSTHRGMRVSTTVQSGQLSLKDVR